MDLNKYMTARSVVETLWKFVNYVESFEVQEGFEEAITNYFRERRNEPLNEVDLMAFYKCLSFKLFALVEYTTEDLNDMFCKAKGFEEFTRELTEEPWFIYWMALESARLLCFDAEFNVMTRYLRRHVAYLRKEDKQVLKGHVKLLLRGWARLGSAVEDMYYSE